MSLLQSHLNNYGHTIFEDNDSESGGGMELRDLSVVGGAVEISLLVSRNL